MAGRFDGNTVLVTGAAGAPGRAYKLAFGHERVDLILADVNEEGRAEARRVIGGAADEIANPGLFLAPGESSSVSDQVILFDRGNRVRGFRQ